MIYTNSKNFVSLRAALNHGMISCAFKRKKINPKTIVSGFIHLSDWT